MDEQMGTMLASQKQTEGVVKMLSGNVTVTGNVRVNKSDREGSVSRAQAES